MAGYDIHGKSARQGHNPRFRRCKAQTLVQDFCIIQELRFVHNVTKRTLATSDKDFIEVANHIQVGHSLDNTAKQCNFLTITLRIGGSYPVYVRVVRTHEGRRWLKGSGRVGIRARRFIDEMLEQAYSLLGIGVLTSWRISDHTKVSEY